MNKQLKRLCKQSITSYAYVGSDRNNDSTWQTDVVSEHVVLTNIIPIIVHLGMMTGSLVVKSANDLTTYGLTDYTIDYNTGLLARTVASTISSGVAIHVTYSWQTVQTFLARIEEQNRLIINDIGQEMLSTCQIYCDNDVVITTKYKITSTHFKVMYPEILKIDSNPNEFGVLDHIVVYTK